MERERKKKLDLGAVHWHDEPDAYGLRVVATCFHFFLCLLKSVTRRSGDGGGNFSTNLQTGIIEYMKREGYLALKKKKKKKFWRYLLYCRSG